MARKPKPSDKIKVVLPKSKKLKVAILGTAPDWKDAPFYDEDWEIWVCNRAGLKMKPWHKLFEIHRNWDYESRQAKQDYLYNLAAISPPQQIISVVPLPMPKPTKAEVVIDREAMIKEFGGAIWFSSTFSYMISYAIQQKAAEISFYGVDMESREEYVTQFAGVRHLIHIAKERGIKVTMPERSLLMRDPDPYPDRFETALAYKLEEMCARFDKHQRQIFHQMLDAQARVSIARDQDLTTARNRLNDTIEAWGRIKGALWCAQHIRRLFVFNVLDPDPGDENMIDAESSGPT